MSKQFGLILPGQQKKPPVKPLWPPTRPSVFDESSKSSASDDDAGPPKMRPTGKSGVLSGPSVMERRVARNIQNKALAEDPTIFQYDELFDEMDSKREEAKETKRLEPRKAKYIGRLMEHAERRKLENELRIERQVQKDREEEGEMYKDKDTYVTTAYRNKLESIRQLQEQDARDEYLETIGDVTKQKDLDGFYRHLYEQKLGTQQTVIKPKTAPSTKDVAYKPIKSDLPTSSKQRSYRRHHTSDDDEQTAPAEPTAAMAESKTGSNSTKAHLPNNIDADSDFSIDDSSDEDDHEQQQKQKPQKPNPRTDDAKLSLKQKTLSKPMDDTDKKKHKDKKPECKPEPKPEPKAKEKSPLPSPSAKEPDVPKNIKPPVDLSHIWFKRTTGEVFDAALARYQLRKVARRA